MTRYGLLLVCWAFGGVSWALAGTLDDARALFQLGSYRQIYALGTEHSELLGTPEFDYYFGVAATDAGHAGEGIFSLERYIIRYPANLQARAELARAYFLGGEDDRAREEFETVLKANPEVAVRRTVERFLDLIMARQSRYRPAAAFYIDAGYGWDSNSNGGVSDANINLPVFGNVVTLPSAVRKGDSFVSLAAGGQFTRPLAAEWTLFGGLAVDAKTNRSYHETNLLDTTATAGTEHTLDGDTQMLAIAREVVDVGSERFRSSSALVGEWQHRLDERQALQVSANVARYTYAAPNDPRDSTFTVIGLGYRRALALAWQPLLKLTANFGREANQRNRPDLGRDFTGLRLAVELSPTSGWSFGAGLSYQDSLYSGADVLLATRRSDSYRAFDALASYAVSRTLSVRGELLLSENRSNLSLNQYERNVAAVKMRYEFK